MNKHGSKLMNIDGSVAPLVDRIFQYAPAPGHISILKAMTCLVVNPGTSVFGDDFKQMLAGGLIINVKLGNSQPHLVKVIKDRADLLSSFCKNITSSVDPVNVFMGTMVFDEAITLTTPADSIQVVVQDNLMGIEMLTMSCIISR